MRKQWMAMLSVLGIAGPAARPQQPTATPAPQATKNSNSQGILVSSDKAKKGAGQAGPGGKLQVNQQTLRQQGGGQALNGTGTQTATCKANQFTGGKAQAVGQPGAGTKVQTTATGNNQALTKANVVKGTDVAGGGAGGTKNSQALTKGNAVKGTDVAGGNGGGTKNTQALTKGNAVRGTDVAGGNAGGTKNSQALTKAKLNVNQQNLRQQNQAGRNATQTTVNNNAATTVNNNAVQTTKNNAVTK